MFARTGGVVFQTLGANRVEGRTGGATPGRGAADLRRAHGAGGPLADRPGDVAATSSSTRWTTRRSTPSAELAAIASSSTWRSAVWWPCSAESCAVGRRCACCRRRARLGRLGRPIPTRASTSTVCCSSWVRSASRCSSFSVVAVSGLALRLGTGRRAACSTVGSGRGGRSVGPARERRHRRPVRLRAGPRAHGGAGAVHAARRRDGGGGRGRRAHLLGQLEPSARHAPALRFRLGRGRHRRHQRPDQRRPCSCEPTSAALDDLARRSGLRHGRLG